MFQEPPVGELRHPAERTIVANYFKCARSVYIVYGVITIVSFVVLIILKGLTGLILAICCSAIVILFFWFSSPVLEISAHAREAIV